MYCYISDSIIDKKILIWQHLALKTENSEIVCTDIKPPRIKFIYKVFLGNYLRKGDPSVSGFMVYLIGMLLFPDMYHV